MYFNYIELSIVFNLHEKSFIVNLASTTHKNTSNVFQDQFKCNTKPTIRTQTYLSLNACYCTWLLND